MKSHVKYFQAAGITVQVNSDFTISENTFHSKFRLFEVGGPGKDNIIVNHHFYLPEFTKNDDMLKNEIYKKNQWHIFKGKNIWLYEYNPVFPEDPGYPAIGKFNEDHSIVNIYTTAISEEYYEKALFSSLTLFNTDQVLFAKLLNDRKGLIIHSNGFDINGKGVLLTGKSGAGKSTLSQMLKNEGFDILCDDRMFVRPLEKMLWIHGHWCHGTVPDVSSKSVPLKAIFFLEHARGNHIEKIQNKKKLCIELFQSVVKPFLTPFGWDMAFTILEEMINTVDCYSLKFTLDGNICNKLSNLVKDIP